MIGYDESWRLERGFDYTVGLQDTEDDVEEPQEHENEGRDPFWDFGTSELGVSKDGEEPPDHEEGHGQDGAAGVDQDAEDKSVGFDDKPFLRILKHRTI